MKPFLSFQDQLNLLKSRHLRIKSEQDAREVLKSENYYRLSGYFKMFTKPDSDEFIEGFCMKKLMKIYEFDAKLRFLFDEYIARVEIYSRTRIAYNLARVTTPDSYYDSSYFKNLSYHNEFMDRVNDEVGRNSRNPMIQHFVGEHIPIWVIVEILSFGVVSKMYANLLPRYKKAIYDSPDYLKRYNKNIYGNNLQVVCNLRNICAHHGRLYGKIFPYSVNITNRDELLFVKYGLQLPVGSTSTCFHLIFALCNLMYSNKEVSKFVSKLKRLIFKYRHYIDIAQIGFSKNWFKVLKR